MIVTVSDKCVCMCVCVCVCLCRLLGASSGSAGASEEGTGEEGGSKYSKLFAKMWGSKDKVRTLDHFYWS